jgi:hypothetical protein
MIPDSILPVAAVVYYRWEKRGLVRENLSLVGKVRQIQLWGIKGKRRQLEGMWRRSVKLSHGPVRIL